jgi:hypothetical protein
MPLKPLEVRRKGLNVLQNQFKVKKEKLQAQLAEKKSISSQDEKWLDHEANLVDKQQVLEALEKASDYDASIEPCPTRQEVLWVASVINRYIDHVDDPQYETESHNQISQ